MRVEDLVFIDFRNRQKPQTEEDEILCPICEGWFPVKDWEEDIIDCEICGDHSALVCPHCGEYSDTVFVLFAARPGRRKSKE